MSLVNWGHDTLTWGTWLACMGGHDSFISPHSPYQGVMSHVNESCPPYQWVTSPINESRPVRSSTNDSLFHFSVTFIPCCTMRTDVTKRKSRPLHSSTNDAFIFLWSSFRVELWEDLVVDCGGVQLSFMGWRLYMCMLPQHTATHCDTLQHTATHTVTWLSIAVQRSVMGRKRHMCML